MRMRFLTIQSNRVNPVVSVPKISTNRARFSHKSYDLPNDEYEKMQKQSMNGMNKINELEIKLKIMQKKNKQLAYNVGSLLLIATGLSVALAQSLFLNYLLYPDSHEEKKSELKFHSVR